MATQIPSNNPPAEAQILYKGHCTCRTISYCLTAEPMIIHCCHCTWCQRETGTAFALNAVIEAKNVHLLPSTPIDSPPTEEGGTSPEIKKPYIADTPSISGSGQPVYRCPKCQVALWSIYPEAGDRIFFVRTGTLDDESRSDMSNGMKGRKLIQPDVHIYTDSAMGWCKGWLDEEKRRGVGVHGDFYENWNSVWTVESLQRWEDAKKE